METEEPTAHVTVHQRGGVWRYRLLVGKDFSAGAFVVKGDAWEKASIKLARKRHPKIEHATVTRGPDIP